MMVNDKLQPVQRFVLFVDKTYVRSEFLDEQELEEVKALGFEGDKLTVDQRKTIRNRMLHVVFRWRYIRHYYWVCAQLLPLMDLAERQPLSKGSDGGETGIPVALVPPFESIR